MSKITTGFTYGITKQQMEVVRLLTEGKQVDDIARLCFDVRAEDGISEDPAKVKRAKDKIRKWMKDQRVQNAYRSVLREYLYPELAKGIRRIAALIDDKNGWLAKGAANDLLNQFKSIITDDDSKEIVVRIENGPEIGTPEDGN